MNEVVMRLPPDPMTAATARRLLGEELRAAGREDLVSDAALVVTELVCNAVMHARTEILLHVAISAQIARVEVDDGSCEMPAWTPATDDALSGRGLTLVEALTSRWGFHLLDAGGKTVWFELTDAHPALEDMATPEQLLERWADLDDTVPALGREVVLADLDAELVLRSRDHSDSMVREFKLLLLNTEARVTHEPSSQQLVQFARRLDTAAEEFASARHQLRAAALGALAAGRALVTVRLHLEAHHAGAAERYRDALDEADQYCADALMLTPGCTREQRQSRGEVLTEIARQLRSARS